MDSHVFVAGTFDNLHTGHHALLDAALAQKKPIVVGITSDAFVKKFKIGFKRIQPLPTRQEELNRWLTDRGVEASVVVIDDPYEPAASLPELDMIVVTPENKRRGEEINERRKEKGLPPLALLVVSIASAQDQKPISSTRVRNGEIDRTGRLVMPDNLRPELGLPMGTVLIGDAIGSSVETYRGGTVIAVGDITTKTLLTAGVVPALSIVDFQVERKPFPELDGRLRDLNLFRVSVESGPGYIAREAVEAIKKWSEHPEKTMVLAVSGEEDLLALPAIAYGPINSVVYYGQPGKGLVEVVVTEDKRRQAIALLARFT